jgi:F-type H+/Na+-transporting ATPase subunit alpha
VSRVGRSAMVKPMKEAAGRLRLDLAQYRELEAFAAFASDLDRASRAQLDRGARLVELLKQRNYQPYPVEEQVVSIWLGTAGKVDDVPVGDIARFESEFLQYLRHSHGGVLQAIADEDWNDDIVTSLDEAVGHFKQMFLAKDDDRPIVEEEAEALEEGAETREKVRRVKRTPPAR